ncbi:hypothetical protein SprV_0902789700 [Sparganum proliferum]
MSSRQQIQPGIDNSRNPVSKIPRLLRQNTHLKNDSSSINDQPVWVEAVDAVGGNHIRIMYSNAKAIGSGSFGMVFVALLNGEQEVAIKKVLQDKRYKNRELQILRELRHPNIVSLLYFFYSVSNSKPKETYLNLVQEYIPQTLSRVIKHYGYLRQLIPIFYVKLYSFQLIRGLAYVHNRNICHRDIKPQNLLVNPETGVLKICDFGSTKVLVPGEPNVSYICSRYYRAPELIFGATQYTVRIDMWSAGCVIGELLLGRPLFPGDSGVDQLVEIIKVLGTPTLEQVKEMNPQYSKFVFPSIKGCPWEKLITHRPSEAAFDLLRSLLVYGPNVRQAAADALASPFFADLFNQPAPDAGSGKSTQNFIDNFSEEELAYLPEQLVVKIRAVTVSDKTSKQTGPSSGQSNSNSAHLPYPLSDGSVPPAGTASGSSSGRSHRSSHRHHYHQHPHQQQQHNDNPHAELGTDASSSRCSQSARRTSIPDGWSSSRDGSPATGSVGVAGSGRSGGLASYCSRRGSSTAATNNTNASESSSRQIKFE